MAPQRKRRVTKNDLGDEDRVVTKSRVDVRETRGMAASRIRDTEPAAASNSNPTRPRDKRLEERSAAREKNLGDEGYKIQPADASLSLIDRAGTKSKVDGRPTRKASARRIQDEEPAAASTSNSHQPHEEPDSLVTTQNPGHEDRVVTKSRTHSRPTQGTAPDGTRDKRTRAEEAVEEGSLGRVDYESLSTEDFDSRSCPSKSSAQVE
ncbi:uncharacterized protein MELLADRAFT_65126 [Melampsora larici-populina 98AG31]|uniref:Uncharacterized protein n=1 Tax=Melampsora larici-populina (strain 98AG31 / pathotype 3-4-7) TaxID=747676 RepID=F4RU30_MELLP|nr:uncharacterized protein MELLADRAFT_65126 [Melampsora larici-populina 98AG31]EGG04103.1 hypothetical protein MELLADRAFT_65126 [Melampsora larici-populina 98AG31]